VPRLTTIDQNMAEGAEHLVSMLLRRIAGEDTPSVVMEPTLVARFRPEGSGFQRHGQRAQQPESPPSPGATTTSRASPTK
jgi:hypothetical protein